MLNTNGAGRLAVRYGDIFRFLALVLIAFFCWACPRPVPLPLPPPPVKPPVLLPALVPLEIEAYPIFSDKLAYNRLDEAIKTSLDYLKKLPPDRPVRFGNDTYPVSHLQRSLETFRAFIAQRPTPGRLNAFVAEHFVVYRSTGRPDKKDVLFTGYYEPVLEGRRSPDKEFCVPVHSRPADLLDIDLSLFAPDLKGRRIVGRREGQTVVPYFDRGQIRQQDEFNQIAPPVVWLRDEVDLFILQIQGSGRVALEDGSFLFVQFDSSNGLPYRSVGRMLIDTGKIAARDMSMQAIRKYLRTHPQENAAIMDHNPRYVFFHEGSGPPVGALGVPLTAMRSIAVDRKAIPLAALAYLATDLADVDKTGAITGWSPYNGFALTQDTGSAITGPGRVDLFWGHGLRAEVGAGHLKHSGALYLLVLKTDVGDR